MGPAPAATASLEVALAHATRLLEAEPVLAEEQATEILRAVGDRDITTMSDADLVRAVYDERGRDNGAAYFSRSSVEWQLGNARRFREERTEALGRLGL